MIGMVLMLCGGCASTQLSRAASSNTVELRENGRFLVEKETVPLQELAAQLKKIGVKPSQQIIVEIPENTSPAMLSVIGQQLASNGYRRFIFSKPRKAVAKKGADPLLKGL